MVRELVTEPENKMKNYGVGRNTIEANLILPTNEVNKTSATNISQPVRANLSIENFRYTKIDNSSYSSTEFGLANEIFTVIVSNLNKFSQLSTLDPRQKEQKELANLYKLKGIVNALNLLTVLPIKRQLINSLTSSYIPGIDLALTEYLPHASDSDSKLKLNILACLADLISHNFRFSNPRYNDDLLKDVEALKNKIQANKDGQTNFVARYLAQGIKQEVCASISTVSIWNSILFNPENIFGFINNIYQALIGNYSSIDARRTNSYLYLEIANTTGESVKSHPFLSNQLSFVFTQLLEELWSKTILPLLQKQNVHISEIRKIQANFKQIHNFFWLQLEQSKQITNQNSSSKLESLKKYLTK